jgi:L-amino acid N-acyltransferase YncA
VRAPGLRPELTLRDCDEADLAGVTDIYAQHVLHGTASFEEVSPDLAEMRARWQRVVSLGLPWLVVASPERVLGYAYAAPFHTRPAYRYTLEDSVYVAADAARRGIGRALVTELLRRAEAAGCRQMIAVIGDSANEGSIRLHAGLGFAHAGLLRSVGFKFGRWLDVVTMQRALGPGDGAPGG